jgi:hypothetical protein
VTNTEAVYPSELERRDAGHIESERQLRAWQDRTAAAEAELERVRAERDEGEIRWNAAEQRVAGLITALSAHKASLDRAVAALREIELKGDDHVAEIARNALAEIDWPDGASDG